MQPIPTGYPIAELFRSGPYIVAYLLNWGLFGNSSGPFLCSSVCRSEAILQHAVSNRFSLDLYYLAFPNDRRFTKYLVYGIYIIEFVQTMLIAHDVFATFGYGFGDVGVLNKTNFNWLTVPIMSAVAACVGQVFYAYRIFILSKSRIIPIFITCVSLISSVAAMILGIYSFLGDSGAKMNKWHEYFIVGIWCRASTLCDILIAICMTYYASSFSPAHHYYCTRMLVTKLIRLIIEMGSVTAVVSLLTFILVIVLPYQIYYITPGLLVPKLYANTVYMVLNSRFQIIGGRDTYVFNRYEFLDHDDKRYHLSVSRRHTACGRDARTCASGHPIQ
ncbi:hypothetical protein ARMGADRAFT_1088231 [Armillaria gallica]|uniref:DUF6534 domain-containing protein n=1 Tax=Armillaria gallica TaxID=47427 RepID=A0A2H3CP33_ARMGA|nr:hypothetical protein ARMGADRAFT_1088231 [Armillaria gallica]